MIPPPGHFPTWPETSKCYIPPTSDWSAEMLDPLLAFYMYISPGFKCCNSSRLSNIISYCKFVTGYGLAWYGLSHSSHARLISWCQVSGLNKNISEPIYFSPLVSHLILSHILDYLIIVTIRAFQTSYSHKTAEKATIDSVQYNRTPTPTKSSSYHGTPSEFLPFWAAIFFEGMWWCELTSPLTG